MKTYFAYNDSSIIAQAKRIITTGFQWHEYPQGVEYWNGVIQALDEIERMAREQFEVKGEQS